MGGVIGVGFAGVGFLVLLGYKPNYHFSVLFLMFTSAVIPTALLVLIGLSRIPRDLNDAQVITVLSGSGRTEPVSMHRSKYSVPIPSTNTIESKSFIGITATILTACFYLVLSVNVDYLYEFSANPKVMQFSNAIIGASTIIAEALPLLAIILFFVSWMYLHFGRIRFEGGLESYAMASRETLTSLTVGSSIPKADHTRNVHWTTSVLAIFNASKQSLWQHMPTIAGLQERWTNAEGSYQTGLFGPIESYNLLTELAYALNNQGNSQYPALPPQVELTLHNSSIELKRQFARPLAITLSFPDTCITMVVLRNKAESAASSSCDPSPGLSYPYRIAWTSHPSLSANLPYILVIPAQLRTSHSALSLTLFPFQVNLIDRVRQVNCISSTEWRLKLGVTSWE
jgi:hypothetical protein